MGFLVGILRKLGSSSIVSNMGPKLNLGTKMHSFGTLTRKNIFLEDIKHEGTLEQKKACLKELLHEMVWRMRSGIQGGCTDPEQIPVIHRRAYLPDETYVVGKYPSYLFSVKDLAVHLHENDQMSSRDSIKFEDFKIYTSLLNNTRHLVLLAGHPHLQTTVQELAYIPAALHQMDLIPAKQNARYRYRYRHFPLPHPNCRQVPLALAFTTPKNLLHQWQDAYKCVCVNRRVHIARSIASAGKEFHDVYNYRSSFKTKGYDDRDPIDELRYYSNVIKHLDNEPVDSLHDMFPYNTMEMFKFHWCYDRHAMGTINLESIQQQDRLYV